MENRFRDCLVGLRPSYYSPFLILAPLLTSPASLLLPHLQARAPLRPWLLSPDELSDRGPAELAVEATREALFVRLHGEVPYALRVEPVAWTPLSDGSLRIEQDVWTVSIGQKRMVVGLKGAVIGAVGMAAGRSLEELFDRKVHLVLRVRVKD